MFREIILPIFRRTRLCVTACGIMQHPGVLHYTTSCNTQSSAPEDGQNNFPKHVELTGIINKPLLLHLVGCLYYLCHWSTVKQISDNEIYLLIKYIKSILRRVVEHLSYIEDARCLKVNAFLITASVASYISVGTEFSNTWNISSSLKCGFSVFQIYTGIFLSGKKEAVFWMTCFQRLWTTSQTCLVIISSTRQNVLLVTSVEVLINKRHI